jgi:hypothetical protein
MASVNGRYWSENVIERREVNPACEGDPWYNKFPAPGMVRAGFNLESLRGDSRKSPAQR